MTEADLASLYRQMLRCRRFEEAVAELWQDGLIAGEMHLGTGEEAIIAGVLAHLRDGDALALDHRGTAALLLRGVDPLALLREFLGRPDGLCGGRGGHMHLFSPAHLAASSGIVGAGGPAALGFALAARRLRPDSVAVAFFGEGAAAQGMLLESLNLAVAWRLPALFVCKDNNWAITTRSADVSGAPPADRARGLGMATVEVDGVDVLQVWQAAGEAVERAREGAGPTFIHARCSHLDGHFLGDPLLRVLQRPVQEMGKMAGPLVRAILSRQGAPLRQRLAGQTTITGLIRQAHRERSDPERDPIDRARHHLGWDEERLRVLDTQVTGEVEQWVVRASVPAGEQP